ncbi:putative proteasome component [Renibacterium salmoninarum ATCC 33209]|uniref:Putative proteasome component n=1 Tax=Renibacterium salmoninarum (strain ATCC 33209 / DSM 20767 / JCM 11484 / NBRC 15589 / NCIMB 2235) TaxID=288705 RepID=A9WSI3_RENSM|nr:depupylase/deamidase Dop [Renibacterium salmoninarum]ABY23771.1 putative proteasome component [Renibacterium salmoninarum ATCC 33209]
MTAVRVMGAETEYGIHTPGAPGHNATWLSSQVVHGYSLLAAQHATDGAETRWDYSDEDPLADARGWTVPRGQAHPSQLTDEPGRLQQPDILTAARIALSDWGSATGALDTADPVDAPAMVMNMVLGNGARFYVDHAHPEYSSPEVTNPEDALIWDFAGEAVARQVLASLSARRAAGLTAADRELPEIQLYKNNTDSKSASYGSHENYLMPRQVPFQQIVSGLTPFFVTRQLICGAGRVGIGQDGSRPGFQLSQRSDFFEAEVGLETTIRRPIINTRDEPHAVADKYRRLHVIIGDANLSQVSHYLKFGTTALVLDLIERGLAPRLEIWEPVEALQSVSHDVGLQKTYRLIDGRRVSALEVQWMYFEAASQAAGTDPDRYTRTVLDRWEATLSGLGVGYEAVSGHLEWAAKLALLNQYRDRDGLAWDDPRLALIDLQWADIRLDKGLANRLQARGRLETLVATSRIESAVSQPPEDTRAYFRGECIRRFGANVVGASWDSVIFELPQQRRLQKIPTREPLRGTKALTGELFDANLAVEDFVQALLGAN